MLLLGIIYSAIELQDLFIEASEVNSSKYLHVLNYAYDEKKNVFNKHKLPMFLGDFYRLSRNENGSLILETINPAKVDGFVPKDIECKVYGGDPRVNYHDKPVNISYLWGYDNSLLFGLTTTVQESNFPRETIEFIDNNEVRYLGGHVIDHKDTTRINPYLDVGDPVSTLETLNFIPEPWDTYWGLHVRNPQVRSIRKNFGIYTQAMHYPFIPRYVTTPVTKRKTPIVSSVHFSELSKEGEFVNQWHIPWDDHIHSASKMRILYPKSPRYRHILKDYQMLLAPDLPHIFSKGEPIKNSTILSSISLEVNPLSIYHIKNNALNENNGFSNILHLLEIMPNKGLNFDNWYALLRTKVENLSSSQETSLRVFESEAQYNVLMQKRNFRRQRTYWRPFI